MDKVWALAFAKDWIDSWNSHNIDAILSHYTEDFSITSPLALQRFPECEGTLIGKENVRPYWELGLELNPNLAFELITVLTGVNSISIYYLSKVKQQKVVETMFFNTEQKVYKAIVNYE